jgi:cytochrome c peroxidase
MAIVIFASSATDSGATSQVTPAMAKAFEFGSVSALAMFPVTSRIEMRGSGSNNELAAIPDTDLPGIWSALMRRLGAIPEYRGLFEAAYPGTRFEETTFAHASITTRSTTRPGISFSPAMTKR